MRQFARGHWVLLLLAGLMVTADTAQAQVIGAIEQAPPTPLIPWPIGRPRMEDGGFFVAAEFLYLTQNNPILSQPVAYRGFIDTNGSIVGVGLPVGSGREALNANQVAGPGTFEPGIALYGGWRFANGVSVELSWLHISDARYSASATLVPAGFAVGPNLADSFLFSPVYNFSANYAGPPKDVNVGTPGATFGIWNAASLMTIDYVQRFDQGMINAHVPVYKGENYRMYGIIGGRTEVMWSRFRWRTVDLNVDGVAAADDTAIYSNVVSNRWYGANFGCGGDWFLGDSPMGAFAVTGEIHGAIGLDFVKERARYELGDFSTASSRNRNDYTFSPLVQGDLSFWWFPTQGVQLRLGWEVLGVFNTVAARRPIDFNANALTPGYDRGYTVLLHGLHVGISFVF